MKISFLRVIVLSGLLALLAHSLLARAQTETPRCARPPVASGQTRHTLESGGETRSYVRYVPPGYDPTQPGALVLSLHGIVSDGAEMVDFTGWNALADEHNFIVVYPDALFLPNLWVFFPTPDDMHGGEIDDVRFFEDLLTALDTNLCIDANRVYVNGFSAGGSMSLYLACRIPERFAAVGVVAPPFIAQFEDRAWCPPGAPLPTIAFHSTADTIVPYEGGEGFGWEFAPYETWTALWAARSGCDATPETLVTPEDVRAVRYVNCANNAEVVAYTIIGGAHAWPGGEPPDGFEPITSIDASALMWDFFARHERDTSG
ncbi:MAG: hypothetical protein HXY40_15785 [Chloroflexi bacterium]|nr:hypothetical protein [Chloroflexota bacterium]